MTLRLYDVAIDGYREPVQDDLDAFMALNRAYGRIREAFTRGKPLRPAIAEAHAELMADMKVPPTITGQQALPVWSCGHVHALRVDAIACLAQQSRDMLAPYMDPVQGLHPIGGLGLPHAGCSCKNCVDARSPTE